MKNIRQKGAMFGLDARITMLIVALLGIIVFPFMNGIISKSRAEAILATTQSVTGAIESFIEDTTTVPANINMLYDTLPTKANHQTNWNGPYLNGNKTDRFVPDLTWITMDNDCTVSSKASGYCSLRVQYDFCDFPQSVFEELKNYYSADQVLAYNSTTDCITINYGFAKTGSTESYAGFKVRELP